MKAPNHRPGRPQKYGRPTRAVTVSLPEDVLAWLRAVDADLGRAIVTLAERPGAPPGAGGARRIRQPRRPRREPSQSAQAIAGCGARADR